ncbi:MAG TPA: PD-(D/E)XK nuclease family protein [Solirubrobacteraceae bacterium]|nr:PD-(D/E)XK nuclease family protein [Solirubrobacteraceae bacterium]
MPITLVTGPANAGKARIVLDALRAHHARGEEPLLVVPTRPDVEHYRRELALEGLVLGVRVERFQGLLAEIVRRAGPSGGPPRGRPLSRLARERVLAAVLRRISTTRATPGVVRALAALVGELEAERVTSARLREALRAWAAADPGNARRARQLGDLFAEYHRSVEELQREDPERRTARALDALRRAPALWGATPVLLYGFDDLPALQLDAIETLGVLVGARVTVSLTYEPGRVAFAGRGDTFQRLLPLAAEHRQVGPRAEYYAPASRPALHHLERHLFEPHPPPPVSAREAVRLLEGGGERAELELVAEEIRGLLDGGMRPAEIAVAHRSPGAIAELLGEVFAAHRIPHALQRKVPFAHTALGHALLGLLAAAFEPLGAGRGDAGPEGAGPGDGGRGDAIPGDAGPIVGPGHTGIGEAGPGYGEPGHVGMGEAGAGELLAWLRAPGVLRRPELADALERAVRRTGTGTAAQARALWESEHWPLDTLDHLREAAQEGPVALIERTARELERLFCAPRLRAAEVLGPADLPQARALAAGRVALEELRELALAVRRSGGPPAEPQPVALDPDELIATLRGLELVVGEEPSADAVAVLDPLTLRARRVRALFLCGLQEGLFPAPPRPEPFLSEEDRRGLAQASGLRLGVGRDARHSLAAERYLLYAAVSRPEELLVLSWHTADDDGLPSPRSLFVEDVCDLFACDLHEARTRRALGEVGEGRGTVSAGPRESPTGVLVGGISPLRHPAVLAELGERPWSASGLQRWAGCPVRWFVESLLNARDLYPEPEPLARGGLAHAALADVLEGLRRETGSARLIPERLPRARELLRAALEEHAGEYPLSTAPERVPGVRRRLEADLERYLEHAAACAGRALLGGAAPGQDAGAPEAGGDVGALGAGQDVGAPRAGGDVGAPRAGGDVGAPRAGGDIGAPRAGGDIGAPRAGGDVGALEPAHTELSFGFPEEPGGLPALDLGGGVQVRGRIDRVDLTPGGEAVVYDYKSSLAPPPDRWAQERSFQIPLYMHAVEQLLGTPVVGGFYQPLSGRDLRARGVLAAGEGVELECVRGDVREPEQARALVQEIVAAAQTAAAQARAGALEARPGTCGFGDSGCMYPAICRCER